MLESVNRIQSLPINADHSEENTVSTYETARNGFAIIGLLTVSGFIGFIGWHAIAAFRHVRSRRWSARAIERARARVQARPISIPSSLGDDSFGDC